MRTPDFIGLGIMHSGTGWLWRQLKAHPDFYLPTIKETNFLLDDEPLERYYEMFAGVPKDRITGEFSVQYFQSDHARERILNEIPKSVKLFCVVRNPVDTAFSYYKGSLHAG